MAKLTGIVKILADGISLRAKDGAKIDIGGYEREAQYADGVLIGYTEKPIAATVTATLVHDATADLIKIRDMVNVTLIFKTDTGVSYTVRGAFCTKMPTLTGGNGEVEVEFMGNPAI